MSPTTSNRGIFDRSRPVHIDGTRIALRIPYEGPVEVLRLRASTFSLNPPRAIIGTDQVTVYRDVPADTLDRNRAGILQGLWGEIDAIETHLGYARKDIRAFNERLRNEVPRAAEARRSKVLADRDTAAMLGVPLARDNSAARSSRVNGATRNGRFHHHAAGQAKAGHTNPPCIE